MDSKGFRTDLVLVAIIALAAALRVHDFVTQSLWLDEAISFREASGSLPEVIAATLNENFPPLHNVILWASMAVLGDAEWALRLPSVLMGMATVGLVYLIGVQLESRRVGLLAALFLAVSPFHIWYAQEARMYALLAFAAALFAACALAYRAKPSPGRLAAMALAGAVLLYSHVFGTAAWIGILVGLAPYLRGERDKAVGVALGAVASALMFAPWVLVSMGSRIGAVAADGFWIAPTTLHSVLHALLQLTGGVGPAAFLLTLIAAALLARGFFRPSVWFVGCWCASSIVADLAVSLLVVPLFISRYLIASLPPLLLLAAIGAGVIARHWRPATAILAVLGVATGLTGAAPAPRAQWREAAAWLTAQVAKGDCVLVVASYSEAPLDYYLRGRLPCVVPVDPPDRAAALLPEPAPPRLFVVVAHANGSEAQVLAALADRYAQAATEHYRGIELYRLDART